MMDSLEEITEKSLLAEEDTGTRHPPKKKNFTKEMMMATRKNKIKYINRVCVSVLGSVPEWQATGGSRNASRPPLLCLTEIIYTLMHALLCPNLPAVEVGWGGWGGFF